MAARISRSDRTDIGPIISDRERQRAYDRLQMDTGALLLIGLTATIVLWVVTWVRQPEARGLAMRGLAVALVVAAVLALIVVGLATLVLGYALNGGLFAGAVVGAGFVWLNVLVLAVGLWFKPDRSWAVGACLATPVIVAAIGFGYVAYRAWPS
jgi:hypothetical protein